MRSFGEAVRDRGLEASNRTPKGNVGVTDDPLLAEYLSPVATLVDEVLARVGYEVATATEAIDDAVPGYGGLFDPATTFASRRRSVRTASSK